MRYSRPNNVVAVLVAGVGATKVEIHAPRVVATILRATPMVACCCLRHCIFVTPNDT